MKKPTTFNYQDYVNLLREYEVTIVEKARLKEENILLKDKLMRIAKLAEKYKD